MAHLPGILDEHGEVLELPRVELRRRPRDDVVHVLHHVRVARLGLLQRPHLFRGM